MYSELANNGVRLTVDAEDLLKSHPEPWLIKKILALEKPFIQKEDLEKILFDQSSESGPAGLITEIVRPDHFNAMARDYSPNIKFHPARDVTGKSRTKGEVENFVNYFRDRYSRLSRLLTRMNANTLDLCDVKKHVNEKARIVVLISEKKETKKGNLLFDVEDMTGTFKVVVSFSKTNADLIKKAGLVLRDDVVAISGKIFEPYLIAEDIEWPDLPVVREKKKVDVDVAVAYLSDLHFGSRFFLGKKLDSFVDWIHGKGEAKELAGKVKYVIVAGDVVDGIGVYPNQEKELLVRDIYEQYRLFDDFVERLPDYVEIIVAPGNHDAVRRGEPQPAIGTDLMKCDVHRVGNPSVVSIEGLKHLIYHGTSMDSMISGVPNLSYMHPEGVMVEYLRRRHLSPIYGGNLIVPENIDYMVIEDVPDVFHSGHVHKNGYKQYRGTLIINSGTFQGRTDFQIKQGHVPTPALVPVYELKYERLRTLDFNTE